MTLNEFIAEINHGLATLRDARKNGHKKYPDKFPLDLRFDEWFEQLETHLTTRAAKLIEQAIKKAEGK